METLSRRSWSSKEFRQVDGARSSFLGEHSFNAHDQRSGSGGVGHRPKLRSPQCHEFGDSSLMAKIGFLVGLGEPSSGN